ncbi:RdgB/HAM1 family non-canonical purine NTP pyrophosphatase [Wenzhouxiangella sp. XN79A]|uniref:RdgB/HAM1 family non-canonical purine NTP pyrophosphatase n=1 Tax=Wenzhouxiangella sp. XN79A TaxID=2724193 RepID=UPI00144A4DDD|nr:RdgB/HAM1 family non-canonical purine NTP pyrophosphatase [Wenzhouxiangella sp. XN79A]NKI36156.1 RdgB/HAM1 family non-canonical purine NTP pyrophosphatase [Wenzhouxiangella sp. XN79A]
MAMPTLVIASGNAGKLAEFDQMLSPLNFSVKSQADYGVVPPPETGRTFVENALIKARAASEAAGGPALGDDSGLVVDALDGRPGIRSARFAGEDATDQDNIDKLLDELRDLPEERRGAYFYCCLVLLQHADDPAPLIATGRWHGYILEARRGTGGFGYDPVFHDPRMGATAAELPAGEKNRVSHRGRALDQLIRLIGAA